mmetsp:Transcript_13816/g.45242  ORF Transcript_13816/g.45242 Transcript_13816/m.45242 type:complete len:225 (-) Transcript_13816:28-702(-)
MGVPASRRGHVPGVVAAKAQRVDDGPRLLHEQVQAQRHEPHPAVRHRGHEDLIPLPVLHRRAPARRHLAPARGRGRQRVARDAAAARAHAAAVADPAARRQRPLGREPAPRPHPPRRQRRRRLHVLHQRRLQARARGDGPRLRDQQQDPALRLQHGRLAAPTPPHRRAAPRPAAGRPRPARGRRLRLQKGRGRDPPRLVRQHRHVDVRPRRAGDAARGRAAAAA